MGVSPSAFRKWLKGEAEPSRERLVALADAAQVGIAWLTKGEGPESTFDAGEAAQRRPRSANHTVTNEADFLLLPKRPEAVAAGPATPIPPTGSEYIAFKHEWLRSVFGVEPEDLSLEVAIGESMQPTIHDGDLLLIDTSDRHFRNFGIYVMEIEGERLVKRVQRKLDGTLLLISDNEIYETDRISPERAVDVVVLGRVVWAAGRI